MERKKLILQQFRQRLEEKYGSVRPDAVQQVFDKLLSKDKVSHQVRVVLF